MFKTTPIADLLIFEPKIYADDRGYFFESYNKEIFSNANINCEFVQDNQSCSEYSVLRGLHFQIGESAQAKLVRVLHGKVLDVAVDLRTNSKTFGKYFSIELSDQNQKQLFIPRGFAHGFVVLSANAIFSYKCDNFYNPKAEAGIKFNDPDLAIDWQIPSSDIIINQRDQAFPCLREYIKNLEQQKTEQL